MSLADSTAAPSIRGRFALLVLRAWAFTVVFMKHRVRLSSRTVRALALPPATALLLGASLSGIVPAAAAPNDLSVASATVVENSVTVSGQVSSRTSGPVRVAVRTSTTAAKKYTPVGVARPAADGSWTLTFTAPVELPDGPVHVMVTVKVKGKTMQAQADAVAVQPPAPTGPLGRPEDHAYLTLGQDGSPSRWDPCTPISYYINPHSLPEGAFEVLTSAFEQMSQASGIPFVYAGPTEIKPFIPDSSAVPSGVPDGVYVAFASEAEAQSLVGSQVGLGGHRSWDDGSGSPQIRIGAVLMETTPALSMDFAPGMSLGGVFMHELGHVMNLAHVEARDALMTPYRWPTSPSTPQIGDLTGLANLKAPGCFAP